MRINVTRSSLPPFDEYASELRDLWESHWLTNNGDKLKRLEKELAAYLGTPHLVMFTNGHMALEAMLRAMNLKGEVITTPFTFASTTHALVRCGLTPVFCDIDPQSYTLDPARVEERITERTCAILPVHVYGNLCDDAALRKIADRHGLKLIYDAAHTFGVSKNGTPSARMGDAAMFSFHATKVFHTIEGGAVATGSDELAAALELERNYGIVDENTVVSTGGNAKMSEFQAIMGLCNLRHVGEYIEKRSRVTAMYDQLLSGRENIVLPVGQPGVVRNHAYYPVLFTGGPGHRDRVCQRLLEHDIYARKYFYPLVTDFDCYQGRPGFDSRLTPVAARVAGQVATLPLYPDLSPEDVELICRVVSG